jgi:cephalosporin-C deacetylase-like acetyl esterase
MVEPEKLAPTMDEPADFDEFWNGVKAELAKTPVKVLDKKTIKHAKLQIYDIKVACNGDKPVSGYLAMPKNAKPKSCPAYVSFHGAGVGSAYIAHSLAASGVITFDINAHGIENGNPRAFYDKLKNEYYLPKGKAGYPHWGKEDRNSFYFKGMFMRVMRALEYVKSLPEWNGKHLIVSGSSQGGAQVLVACAMDKDISLARCEVPAMCDHFAEASGRQPGWPRLLSHKLPTEKPEPEKVAKCASYFDGVYFAKRIKCPIYLYTGFIDVVCAPTSVYAAYNNIPAETFKSIYTVPTAGHSVPEKEFTPVMLKHIGK